MAKKAKSSKKRPVSRKCQHGELYPVAAFYDEESKQAYLLQVCCDCGQTFLLNGLYPLTVY